MAKLLSTTLTKVYSDGTVEVKTRPQPKSENTQTERQRLSDLILEDKASQEDITAFFNLATYEEQQFLIRTIPEHIREDVMAELEREYGYRFKSAPKPGSSVSGIFGLGS